MVAVALGVAVLLVGSGCGMMISESDRQAVAPGTPVAGRTVVTAECSMGEHLPRPMFGETALVEPEPMSRVIAPYPQPAREANVSGVVRMAVLVCEHGKPVEIRVTESIPLLDDASIDAARQWTFRPSTVNGKPVPAWTEVPMRFTLH